MKNIFKKQKKKLWFSFQAKHREIFSMKSFSRMFLLKIFSDKKYLTSKQTKPKLIQATFGECLHQNNWQLFFTNQFLNTCKKKIIKIKKIKNKKVFACGQVVLDDYCPTLKKCNKILFLFFFFSFFSNQVEKGLQLDREGGKRPLAAK
jgi:hypothetical protein